MSETMLRSNLPDLYLEDALPFIESIIEEEHEGYDFVSEKIFNVRNMQFGIAQHSQVSALQAAAEVGEAQEIPQDKVRPGYSTTYKSKKYGLLLATSQESIDDEKYDSIGKNPAKMGRAMASAREITAAAIFNSGFTSNGSDGVPLFSLSHPLIQPGAGTSANRLAVDADLSSTSLKDLVTVFKKQLDTAGNKLMIKPKKLLVPSELEYLAYELLKSSYDPQSGNNSVNSMGPEGLYKIEPICWEYLTDPDAFFLVSDTIEHDLYWFWSKKPEVKTEMEFKTDVAMTRMLSRWAVGYSDWRGVAGSPGA